MFEGNFSGIYSVHARETKSEKKNSLLKFLRNLFRSQLVLFFFIFIFFPSPLPIYRSLYFICPNLEIFIIDCQTQ